MGFFDDISKIAKNVADKTTEFATNTADKTSDLFEIGRFKSKIHDSEKTISDKKQRLGELLWNSMKDGFVPENKEMITLRDEIAKEYEAIDGFNKEIEKLQKES